MNEPQLRAKLLSETLDKLVDDSLEEALQKTLMAHESSLGVSPTSDGHKDFSKSLLAELQGFGPIDALISDETVTEIIVQGSCEIIYERQGELFKHESRYTTQRTFQLFLNRILLELEKSADRQAPLVDGVLADGTRVHVALPPAADMPVVTLRKHRKFHWTLKQLVDLGVLSWSVAARLKESLLGGANIIVCGGTGSGKTTLMRALLSEVPERERIITIEDTPELGLQGSNRASLRTRSSLDDRVNEITLSDLLKNSLRMRPDRLVVGEIRGEEALVFLDAVATGHQGSMSSIHGGTCHQALRRLESLALRAAPHWGMTALRQTIREGVNLIVCLERKNKNRRVHEIMELSGVEDFGYLLNPWNLEG